MPDGPTGPRPTGGTAREHELSSLLFGYLSEHPGAADTLRGIAQWWVARQQIRVELDLLAKVLDRLVCEGQLEVSGHGPQAVYRLRPVPAP